MNRQKFLRGCLVAGLLGLFLLAAGGGWWYYRSHYLRSETPPDSPVFVFLLSPISGEEVEAGNFVPVRLQAVAPEPIQSSELFMDGQSLGVVTESPESGLWAWHAWPLGLHTLFARATAADGQVGQSQTVIVNVLARDGLMEISAEEGQTLEQIGEGFGVPADQMAEANPEMEPSQPLTGGQPVQVPVGEGNGGDGGAGNGSGQGGEAASIPLITWQFISLEPVDKSYCYTSTGNGIWEKMPGKPFDFFQGTSNLYTQFDLMFAGQVSVIQMQCWGWQAGVLKFLGQGEASFDLSQPSYQLVVNGPGFQLIGSPQIPVPEEKSIGGLTKTIPPPFALRAPADAADCTAHGNPFLAPFICNTLMNAPVKEYLILEWEWQPKTNLPGEDKWLNAIDGYRLYEIDPVSKAEIYLKDISNLNQKVAAVPIPWSPRCYGVRAFVNDPVIEPSEMMTFCPGDMITPQKITLAPIHWLTLGESNYMWESVGYPPDGVFSGAVRSGSVHNRAYAAVKFESPTLPPGAVVQKVMLKFQILWTVYESDTAIPYTPSCLASVGRAGQNWIALDGGAHNYVFVYTQGGTAMEAHNSDVPLPEIGPIYLEVDVTYIAKKLFANPSANYGFMIAPRPAPNPPIDGDRGACLSTLGIFQLDIYYFAP